MVHCPNGGGLEPRLPQGLIAFLQCIRPRPHKTIVPCLQELSSVSIQSETQYCFKEEIQ